MRNTEETPHFRTSITSPSFPGTIPTKTGTSVMTYKHDSTKACPKKKDIQFPTKNGKSLSLSILPLAHSNCL